MTVRNEAEEKAIKSFLELEAECDAHNLEEIAKVSLDHLNKTKTNQAITSIRQWEKVSSRLLKMLKTNASLPEHKRYKFTSKERTWLMTA